MPFIHYSASIQDVRGQRKVVDTYLQSASLSGEPAGLNAWLADLDAMINGVIVAAQVRMTPALPTTLATNTRTGFSASRVEDTGEFRFNLAGSPKHWTQAIPAFSPALLTGNKTPNISAAAVTAYVGLLTGASFTDNTGLGLLTTLYGAFSGTRKAKGLRSATFVAG